MTTAGDVLELVRAPAALTVARRHHRGRPRRRRRGSPAGGGCCRSRSVFLYSGGMALNDYADRDLDAVERPERPIPSGRVPARRALGIAAALMAAGLGLAAAGGGRRALARRGPARRRDRARTTPSRRTPRPGPSSWPRAAASTCSWARGGGPRGAARCGHGRAAHRRRHGPSRGEVHGGSAAHGARRARRHGGVTAWRCGRRRLLAGRRRAGERAGRRHRAPRWPPPWRARPPTSQRAAEPARSARRPVGGQRPHGHRAGIGAMVPLQATLAARSGALGPPALLGGVDVARRCAVGPPPRGVMSRERRRLASAIDALVAPLPGAGSPSGTAPTASPTTRSTAPLEVLDVTGYGAVALTLGHPHLDPFADDARRAAARLRERLDELGWRVVVETGTRYLLDPYRQAPPDARRPRRRSPACGSCAGPIDLAAILRAECVSLLVGRPARRDVPTPTAWRAARRRHARGRRVCRRHRGRLGFEPEPGMLVETVADALRLRGRARRTRRAAASPSTSGTASCVEPDGVVGALRAAGALLVNVQVDDMLPGAHEHLELGDGRLDLPLALATLHEIGYRGVAAVELPRHSHDAPGVARRSAACAPLRTTLGGNDDERPGRSTAVADESPRSPQRIAVLFPAAGPRASDAAPVDPAADPLGLRHGTVDDAARAAARRRAARRAARRARPRPRSRDLYRYGDDAERRGVLRGLERRGRARHPRGGGRRRRARRRRAAHERPAAGRRGARPVRRRAPRPARVAPRRCSRCCSWASPSTSSRGLDDRADAELARMAAGSSPSAGPPGAIDATCDVARLTPRRRRHRLHRHASTRPLRQEADTCASSTRTST